MDDENRATFEAITSWPPETSNKPNTSEEIEIKRQKLNFSHAANASNSQLEKCSDGLECNADVGLAKWWKRKRKYELIIEDIQISDSHNPKTVLNSISKTEPARKFMTSEVKRIRASLCNKKLDKQLKINKLTAVATYLEKLKLLKDAMVTIDEALSMDTANVESENIKELKWLNEKIIRQRKIKQIQEQHHCLLAEGVLNMPKHIQVERRSAKEFSVKEFYVDFAMRSKPVVITDLVEHMTTIPWNIEHIAKTAGSCSVTVKKLQNNSVEWARLEDCRNCTVEDYIKDLNNQSELHANEKTYLFDWSLPQHCPKLVQQLIIPSYFANDFLQRLSPGSLYRDSWPSLFIAPPGLRSELHVDAFGSNFWMALFEGSKRWVFFPKEEVPLLYPEYCDSMDPVFDVDLADPDLERHPLLSLTNPIECILKPGELLFVPAGCPHRVENLEKSLAISANFVDESNIDLVKQELHVNGLIDDRAKCIVDQMENEAYDTRMDYNLSHVSWNSFKRVS